MAAARIICMWSGPRNISTAMLRAWENRGDTWVCDEPLYAHYLAHTGLAHPGAAEVLAHHDSDWQRVVAGLVEPPADGSAIYYQKHMAHHLLPHIGRAWLAAADHAFLIRDPQDMLTSLVEHWPEPSLDDTGLPQQVELFDALRDRGLQPAVLDARDVLQNPAAQLRALCARLDVPFTERMLTWPAGSRSTDGVWARHWYHAVQASTGFAPYRPKVAALPGHLRPLLDDCAVLYAALYAHRLRA